MHPGSQILTLLFLQQFEAIDDKSQVDSQALSLEPRAQHDKDFLWEKRGRSLEPAAIGCARRTPVTLLIGGDPLPNFSNQTGTGLLLLNLVIHKRLDI